MPDITIPTCTTTDGTEYVFQGYSQYYDENGKPTITNNNIKGNQTLTAKWAEPTQQQ